VHGSSTEGRLPFSTTFRNLASKGKKCRSTTHSGRERLFRGDAALAKTILRKLPERPGHQSLSFVFATKGFLNSFEESIARCVMKTKHKEKRNG
jgi:hypothetical protein